MPLWSYRNDSDLRYPIQIARNHIPVGVVNPSPNRLAGALQAQPNVGVGSRPRQSLLVS